MKRNLLLVASVFFGASAFAQSLTSANAPAVGDNIVLYIVDSMAPNLASETGASATWDYSATLGYENETREITMLDPAMTGNASSFPISTEAQDLEGFLLNYTINSPSGRESQGFVFTEQSLGEVVARLDVDAAQTHVYPMNISSPVIIDNYSGEVDISAPFAQTSAMTGTLRAEVDGQGTLKLANNDYNNVLRYKIIDTMNVTVVPLGAFELIRLQFEYYDFTSGNLPIFVHTRFVIGQPGGAPIQDVTLVLSKEQPAQFVGLAANVLEQTSVYPNPANDNLNIQLPASIASAQIVISDALGRQVYTSTLSSAEKTIDVSKMNKGIYFVNISNDVYSTTKSVVIK
jgi:hypothetical protein